MSDSTEKKEAYKAEVSSDLARMHDIIMGITPWNQAGSRKGVIVTDDGIHLDSKFAKEHLKYDELQECGKVNEITIDSSWPLNNEVEGEVHALWERLVDEAGKVKQGLLVINVRDINLFKLIIFQMLFGEVGVEVYAIIGDDDSLTGTGLIPRGDSHNDVVHYCKVARYISFVSLFLFICVAHNYLILFDCQLF